jgi:MoaD family protein
MQIKYFALLRNATGKASETWTRPAPDVRTLLNDLIAEYGREFSRWIMTNGELSGIAIILVDGKDVRDRRGLDEPLTPHSEVLIFPPLAGG